MYLNELHLRAKVYLFCIQIVVRFMLLLGSVTAQ